MNICKSCMYLHNDSFFIQRLSIHLLLSHIFFHRAHCTPSFLSLFLNSHKLIALNIKLNHFNHPTYTLVNHGDSAKVSAISAKGVMAPFCDFSCNFPRSFSFCSRQHGNAFPENRRAEHCRNSVLFR